MSKVNRYFNNELAKDIEVLKTEKELKITKVSDNVLEYLYGIEINDVTYQYGSEKERDNDFELLLSEIDKVRIEKDNAINKQIKLQSELQDLGYNIVTCGNCGATLIHKTSDEKIVCVDCGFQGEPSDFPDLYYPELIK